MWFLLGIKSVVARLTETGNPKVAPRDRENKVRDCCCVDTAAAQEENIWRRIAECIMKFVSL